MMTTQLPHGSRPGLRVRSLAALLDEQIPDREPLLGPWLTQRHLSMVYAPAGCGKSMFAMSAALAVAGGGRLFGWEAPKARKVLLVDGEMDICDLKERAQLLLSAVPGADPREAGRNLQILAHQDQEPGVRFPDLATEEGRGVVLKLATKEKAELVILDNLSCLATVEDENAAASFDPIIDLMRNLKLQGAAVILVHHSRKSGNGKAAEGSYRGTSKMAVTFNSIIRLGHPDGVPSKGGTAFELIWEKFRGLRDETVRPLQAHLTHHGDGAAEWQHEASKEAQLEDLVRLVRSCEYPTQDALAEALEVAKGTVSKLKKRAIGAGMISRERWDECLAMARQGDDDEDLDEI